jgi:hypothetical protein
MSGHRTGVRDLEGLRLSECFGMLHVAVGEAVVAGAFSPGDPTLVSLGLWTAVHGMASLLIAQDLEFPPFDDYLQQVLDQNLSGLLAR